MSHACFGASIQPLSAARRCLRSGMSQYTAATSGVCYRVAVDTPAALMPASKHRVLLVGLYYAAAQHLSCTHCDAVLLIMLLFSINDELRARLAAVGNAEKKPWTKVKYQTQGNKYKVG